MITTVTMERAAFLPAPQRFEAGTQKVSQAIALAAAANYLTETGMDRIHAWESLLGQRLVEGLSSIPGDPRPRARRPARSGSAWRPSTSPACTRTTSDSSWTARESPSGSATTARSRCTGGWA